jgi:hypothetical protein
MAQGQAMRLQLRFQGRPERPGRDPRGAGDAIHLQHTCELAKVDRDSAAVAVADVGLDAASDA